MLLLILKPKILIFRDIIYIKTYFHIKETKMLSLIIVKDKVFLVFFLETPPKHNNINDNTHAQIEQTDNLRGDPQEFQLLLMIIIMISPMSFIQKIKNIIYIYIYIYIYISS